MPPRKKPIADGSTKIDRYLIKLKVDGDFNFFFKKKSDQIRE